MPPPLDLGVISGMSKAGRRAWRRALKKMIQKRQRASRARLAQLARSAGPSGVKRPSPPRDSLDLRGRCPSPPRDSQDRAPRKRRPASLPGSPREAGPARKRRPGQGAGAGSPPSPPSSPPPPRIRSVVVPKPPSVKMASAVYLGDQYEGNVGHHLRDLTETRSIYRPNLFINSRKTLGKAGAKELRRLESERLRKVRRGEEIDDPDYISVQLEILKKRRDEAVARSQPKK